MLPKQVCQGVMCKVLWIVPRMDIALYTKLAFFGEENWQTGFTLLSECSPKLLGSCSWYPRKSKRQEYKCHDYCHVTTLMDHMTKCYDVGSCSGVSSTALEISRTLCRIHQRCSLWSSLHCRNRNEIFESLSRHASSTSVTRRVLLITTIHVALVACPGGASGSPGGAT